MPTPGSGGGPVVVTPPRPRSTLIMGSIRVVGVTGKRGSEKSKVLPNLRALDSSFRVGPAPPTANFCYQFDDSRPGFNPYPTRFEHVYPLRARGRGVVKPDDRLAILMDRVNGSFSILFDGYYLAPDAKLSKSEESVPFAVVGTPVREFDVPLAGALMRNSNKPLSADENVRTDLPARFNPDGLPNCTSFLSDEGDPGFNAADAEVQTAHGIVNCPIFTEADFYRVDESIDGGTVVSARHWTLPLAAKYILVMGNPDEFYTRRPDFDVLDNLLVDRIPLPGRSTYDPNDPATYTRRDIIANDIDVTGMPWPDALNALIEPHGFQMIWRLDTTRDGRPDWWLDLARVDEPQVVQSISLSKAGQDADPSRSSLTGLSLQRDSRELVNSWIVDSQLVRYEAGFMLAPGWHVRATDATAPEEFKIPDGAAVAATDSYRLWVLNEDGISGHWAGADWSYTPTDLSDLFRDPSRDRDGERVKYANRRRAPIKKLFTTDANNRVLSAELYLVTGYNVGEVPGLYRRKGGGLDTAVLRKVVNGGWELLPDRIGIRLTCQDPEDWNIGENTESTIFRDGRVRVVSCMAAPDPDVGRPYFTPLLVCTIEGDRGIKALADRRPASPSNYKIRRRDDSRDRYKKSIVSRFSPNTSFSGDEIPRDDTDAALAHAETRRAAHELPAFGGSATIGWIVTYYKCGDQIDKIRGRECPLRTSIGAGQAEGARYPSIVGVDHTYQPKYQTVLQLSDRRAEPAPAGAEGDIEE